METRFRTRISRMFKSSLNSCKPKNLSDIMENQVSSPEKQHSFHMIEPHSPKLQPFPSICKPRCPDATETIVDDHCIVTHSDLLPRRKVSERISPFALGVIDGRMCPPASPVSHFYSFHDQLGFKNEHALMKTTRKQKKKSKKSTCTNTRAKTKKIELCPFSSSSHSHNTNFSGWFSSEDETDTLFSSRSLSSDSSEARGRRRRPPRQKKKGTRRRRVKDNTKREMSVLPLDGKVKDSFAVVKRSSDPYNDFRTSMVEMIVEKQIFAAKDLEQLLQCFLSLNSQHYHRIIVEVFTEIHETLFSSWY